MSRIIVACACLLLSSQALAQTVYKCKNANGTMSFQQSRCSSAKGQVSAAFTGRGGMATVDSSAAADTERYERMRSAKRQARARQDVEWAESTMTESAIAQRNRDEEDARRARISAGSLTHRGMHTVPRAEFPNSSATWQKETPPTWDDEDGGRRRAANIPPSPPDDSLQESDRHSFVDANGNTYTPNDNGYFSATGGGQFYDKGNNRYYSPQNGAICTQQLNEMNCQ
ncbi:DUF4124 domain-containing protein [Solimonas marina]|uniref:DUF4124 domain-containing protein n=1 Tax=Solimonas marina TaxID=2714601 RepID=A0A970B3R6_9GAMM|nr:DUF4124 domain-containing protein [Solimonas marina]NKF21547.1 DUF4124 domain-containing protein [Solimonas marina]